MCVVGVAGGGGAKQKDYSLNNSWMSRAQAEYSVIFNKLREGILFR